MPEVLRRDLPHVMHETIDDEVVVVNLDSGTYYSFAGTGMRIWDCLEGGPTVEGLVRRVQSSFSGDREAMAAAVRAFVEQLRAEDLVSAVPGEAPPEDGEAAAPAGAPAFVVPTLEKYNEMEALLLADPIHEVDEAAGWPKPK